MRLKTYLSKLVHTDFCTAVGWVTPEEVITCGDDHRILIWNAVTHDLVKSVDLPKSLYPTDMHGYPKSVSGSRQRQAVSELFVLGATDGNYHLVNRSGKIEKSVEAHKGAVLVVRWSNDGSALASGGEDGQVKIWSRSGMLRSTLSAHSTPAYTLSWGPNSDCIVYSIECTLEIKNLSPKSKPLQWKAHDGLVLKVSWNQNNNLIVSASEDCRYRVWDSFGRLIFSSNAHEYPITSVAWSPDGALFAVGSYTTLKLCDQTGWSHSLDKPQVHSLLNISWSSDSTQLSAATASGVVIFASVVNRILQWKSYELLASGRKVLKIKDVTTAMEEDFDFRDNIIKLSMEFGYLIVITTNQCHVYKLTNLTAPHSFDLRDPNVSLVCQCDKNFIIVDALNVNLYSYEGRHLNNFKWVGLRIDALTKISLSLSSDTIAARDASDHKIIHFIDAQSGKEMQVDGKPFSHKIEVTSIALNLCESPNERKCAFIDKNSDLYLAVVRPSSFLLLRSVKFATMVSYILWNDEANILSGVLENSQIYVWLYPHIAFVDKELLSTAVFEKDSADA